MIVASKIDKYDRGIVEKFMGRGFGGIKLKLGCVAVLNRKPEEIEENVTSETMRQRERQFFVDHAEAFRQLPDEYKGVDQLVKRLATIQQGRIRKTLPEVMRQLREDIRRKKVSGKCPCETQRRLRIPSIGAYDHFQRRGHDEQCHQPISNVFRRHHRQ